MFRANPQRTGVYNATGVRQFRMLKWKSLKPPAFQSSGSGLAVADGVVCFGSNNDQHLYGWYLKLTALNEQLDRATTATQFSLEDFFHCS